MTDQERTQALEIMKERFGKDSLVALATVDADGRPWVRAVNTYYEDGAFYVVTYGLSNKMQQIAQNPEVSLCGDWFTGHGIGENLGYVLKSENALLMEKLRSAFSEWYSNGHTDESDPNTCILKIRLTEGVLFSHGIRYDLKI